MRANLVRTFAHLVMHDDNKPRIYANKVVMEDMLQLPLRRGGYDCSGGEADNGKMWLTGDNVVTCMGGVAKTMRSTLG